MFFIMGINSGRKDFDFNQVITCEICGSYGRYQVYMTYMVFTLFFIPIFKWNKHYYVQTSCCDTLYELDGETGKRIERGEKVEILTQNLSRVSNSGQFYTMKKCKNCGYETPEDFEFCPKCGTKF